MDKQLTLEDFFLFLLETSWITQTEFGDLLHVDHGTLSRNKSDLKSGGNFKRTTLYAFSILYKDLAHELFIKKSGQPLLSTIETLRTKFELNQTQLDIVESITKTIEDKIKQEDHFKNFVATLESRKVKHTIPKEWDKPKVGSPGTITESLAATSVDNLRNDFAGRINELSDYSAFI